MKDSTTITKLYNFSTLILILLYDIDVSLKRKVLR